MRAVMVDPVNQEVREVETDGSLKSLQALVGGYIEVIPVGHLSAGLAGHHAYLDETGRLKPEVARYPWRLRGWGEQDLCGPLIILRSTQSGGERAASVSVDEVRRLVTWGKPGDYASRPGVSIRTFEKAEELLAAMFAPPRGR